MELEKRYVPVTVHFDANGKMRPIEIEFDETRRYHIDKILDVRRAACQSVGGVGEGPVKIYAQNYLQAPAE